MGADYSLHAKYWDWDGFDDSASYNFWYTMGKKYGTNILSVMCAIGQAAAYMANNGAKVVALDLTREMIEEGKKRFQDIPNLTFVQADVCDFCLDRTFDFCFISSADIHLLPSLSEVKKALVNINKHLKMGGGLGIEAWYAPEVSFSSPMRQFYPRVPRKDGVLIWKESQSEYNAETKIQHIHQIVHVDNENLQFTHDVDLQLYDRVDLLNLLSECGFTLVNAYCNNSFQTSDNITDNCYLELIKSSEIDRSK